MGYVLGRITSIEGQSKPQTSTREERRAMVSAGSRVGQTRFVRSRMGQNTLIHALGEPGPNDPLDMARLACGATRIASYLVTVAGQPTCPRCAATFGKDR